MAKLNSARSAQYVMEAEFSFKFDDTMVNTVGAEIDFGKTAINAAFDLIKLPVKAVVVGGSVTTDTAFNSAAYTVSLGDSGNAARYLAAADRKAAAAVPLLTPGYRGDGEPLRLTVNSAAATAGQMTVRVLYVIQDRANEVCTG